MPITLPFPLTIQEIRVLQEFRRLGVESLAFDALRNIRHPVDGGEAPVRSLAAKGYLFSDESGAQFSVTEKAKAFLAIDVKPDEEGSAAQSGTGAA